MSYGLPVVAFSIDGIPELVEPGKDGVLVTLRDYDQMKLEIGRLLDDKERSAEMGECGRKKVLANFTITQSAIKHSARLQELANGNANG
jgi:glycosyltransferase involved in cell wall biosynthesis